MEGKMMTPEQLEKQPSYVKAEISKLQRELETAKIEVAWLKDENRVKVAKSNTVVVEGIGYETALASDSNIEFRFPKCEERNHKAAITVRMKRDGQSIEVYASDQVTIDPQSGNLFTVSIRKR